MCILHKQVQHFSAVAFVYSRGEKHCIISNVMMNLKIQLSLCNEIVHQSGFLFVLQDNFFNASIPSLGLRNVIYINETHTR